MPITYTVTVYDNKTEWKNKAGKRHREDGPAVEWNDGETEWYLNGERHRENGPAVEGADGTKFWYLNGLLHREDGPAVECPDGTKCWSLNGKEFTEKEFNKQVNKHTSCNGKIVEIDGKRYELKEI